MIKKLQVVPFSNFWTFCTLSDMLSLLISKNPSYYAAAVMNSYYYTVRGINCWWRDVSIDWEEDYIDDIFNKFIFSDVETKEEKLIDTLQSFINKNEYIAISLDVYFIPNRIDYHLKHEEHSVLLTGYDDEKECFFALLDTYEGYGEIEIPFHIVSCSANDSMIIKLIKMKDTSANYIFNLETVINNAIQLRRVLSELSYQAAWINGEFLQEDIANVLITITKYVERQKANSELILYVKSHGIIEENSFELLIAQIESIKRYWEQIKNLFIKSFLNQKAPKYEKLNSLAVQCFALEGYMWHNFIICTQSYLQGGEKIEEYSAI